MLSAAQLFVANGVLRRFLMNGGWLPLSVRLAVDLEFTATELLLLGTSIELAILLGEVPTGVVADVFSRKWSIVLGGLFLSSAQLASGLVDDWTSYLITQFIWGIGWTFLSGAEIAWVTDEVGSADDVERLLLRRGRLQFAAIVAGVLFFAALSLVIPLATAVVIAGVIGLSWTLFLAVVMPETGFTPSQSDHWRTFRETLREGARVVWAVRGLRVLGFALLLGGMAAEAMDRLDVRRLEDIGLSDATSPILLVGVVILAKSALSGLVLWRLEDRFVGRRVVTGFAALIASVGVLSMLLAHVPILVIAVVLLVVQGGLLNVTDPLMGVWANALAPDHARATVHSFIGQARALGEISGGVLLGAVAGVFTLPVAWTAAGVLFVVAAAIASTARRGWPVPAVGVS